MADDLAQAMARRPFAARVLGHLEAVPPVAQG
jgi:hypothetical protein